MAGGSCEATAFGGYGYRAAGLCLPLGNYHNMGTSMRWSMASREATPRMEVISLADFHALVDLLLVAGRAVDDEDPLPERLDRLYEESRHLLRDVGRYRSDRHPGQKRGPGAVQDRT